MVWAGSSTLDVARGAAVVALASVGAAGLVAFTVRLGGLAPGVRSVLGLSFTGLPATTAEVVAIAGHNAALAACAFLGAGLCVERGFRHVIDVILGMLLLANSAVVGFAVGAYGARVIATHLMIEAAAFSLAGGTYVRARRGPLRGTELGGSLLACLCLIAIAASAEAQSW